MRVKRFEVEGYRALDRVAWEPGDLSVVTGPRALELQRAVALYARTAQGWFALGRAMADERAGEADFWHPSAIEVRMLARFAPAPYEELDYAHEVIVERVDGAPGWLVGYERAQLVSDFEQHEVLERIGDRVEYIYPRKKVPGTPILQRAKTEVSRIANDITSLGAVSAFRGDPRVVPFADAVARWTLRRGAAPRDDDPHAPTVPFGFHGALRDDGSNLVNLMVNVYDVAEARRALDAHLRAALVGYDGLRFPRGAAGEVSMELLTRDGRATASSELSRGALRTLGLYGSLLSPQLPPLLWLDDPTGALDAGAEPAVATLAVEAARRAQIVISNPSPALEKRLAEATRRPLRTARGSTLAVRVSTV